MKIRNNWESDGAADCEYGDTGHGGDSAGRGILSIGCRGHGHDAVDCSELAGGLIVGVSGTENECYSVEIYGEVCEHGIEDVRDDDAVGGDDGGVAEILHDDGVGHGVIVGDDRGAHSLSDGQLCGSLDADCGGIGDDAYSHAAVGGGGIGDSRACRNGGELVCHGLIDEGSRAACGEVYAADLKITDCTDRGCRLEHTVEVVEERARNVVERDCRTTAGESVRAEIVGHGEVGVCRSAEVGEGDKIDDIAARCVGVGDRCLGYGEAGEQLSLGCVGAHDVAAVRKCSLIVKGCHICFLLAFRRISSSRNSI